MLDKIKTIIKKTRGCKHGYIGLSDVAVHRYECDKCGKIIYKIPKEDV